MKLFRYCAAAVLAGLLMTGPTPAANAAPVYTPPTPVVSVYNTPGSQFIGGRAWRTQCMMYSSSIVRCRTEIWASQVVRVGSGYRQINGWAFNNLTYLPSPRAAWAGNNLGRTASWTASDGRAWRTECDTALTGKGGCRTFARADVVISTGSGFQTVKRWVFNNQVQFSSASIPAVTSVPKSVLQRAVLTPTGFGPIQLGTSLSIMHGQYLAPGNLCSAHRASAEVRSFGVDLMDYLDGTIGNVWTSSPATPIGSSSGLSTFRVGMTYAQLTAAFPGKIQLVTRNSEGGPFQGASLREGPVELLFYKAWDQGDPEKLLPTDKIVTVRAREAAQDHFYGC